MSIWLIEPRDPLIVGDGRPFGPNSGARAISLPFPYPSTLAGAIRTRAGMDASGDFDTARISELLQYRVRGPLLVERIGEQFRWLAPAPADALLLKREDESAGAPAPALVERRRLAPLEIPSDVQCGWPAHTALTPVGQTHPSRRKPINNAPRFWYWEQLAAWLSNPTHDVVSLDELGHNGATAEVRMHVRVDADTQTAEDGMLFQTAGFEFTRIRPAAAPHRPLGNAIQLALACATDAPLQAGVGFLGGERRLVRWQPVNEQLPECPHEVRQSIVADGHCRLLLLTPAYFTDGLLPTWLKTATPDLAVEVIGVASGRFQGISGWDYKTKGPKAARKLAPAGAVYYLRLEGSPAARKQFVQDIWMQCVSDEPQSRLDGFGLAALGVWNGKRQLMEVN